MSNNNEQEQSETAQANETTQEKVQGALDALGNSFGRLASILARLGILGLILYSIVASVYEPAPMPSLSPTQIVGVITFVVGLAVFYLPTAKAVSKIFNPDKAIVAKIDGSAPTSVVNAWYASPDKVGEMTVEDGRVRKKTIEGKEVHLVNEFNPESNTCKAPREMELVDWEMWGEKKAIERQRHRNNAFIEFGKQLFIRLPAIGQTLESKYWREMSQNQVEKELTEPESFIDAVEDELPDIDDGDVMDEMRAAMDKSQPSTGSTGGGNDE
ncbi:hypothetical protein GOC74_05135 [Halomicrobium mukohataei]|uniref:Uncharacterized protein n=1 Tax=Halomicrobium mukohataei TaxID=57705 RepID=A0A847UD73_9EURY|nr:hypothetical protein [Halomicrobium mukohataei]NLV09314.1 hypothetical protein [Halomicrobium mukohataei]